MDLLKIIGIFIVLIASSLNSCHTSKISISNDATYISFGSLGGFAGSYTEYRVMIDGSAFKKSRYQGSFMSQKPISESTVIQFYNLLKLFREEKVFINDPGNMTYFIKLTESGTDSYELIWGGGSADIDGRIKTYYRTLKSLCIDDHPTR